MQHSIDFLIIERAMMLDIAGPMDVFATANRFLSRDARPYRNRALGLDKLPVALSNGLRVLPDASLEACTGGDTLIVAGGDNDAIERAANNERLLAFFANAPSNYSRVVSICNAALLIGRAGLLDGRRATTHWQDIKLLEDCSPKTTVCDDVLYVRDGNIFTSAGVSAGIDLALHLVELDHGRSIALRTARQLVLHLHRPGGQRQFSELLSAQSQGEPLQALGNWLQRNLSHRVSLDDMAAAVNMSRRNFTRTFREQTGTTPGKYLERLRAETAGNLLAGTTLSIRQVAGQSGFGSEQTLRRVFVRHFGVSPGEYQSRFGRRNG